MGLKLAGCIIKDKQGRVLLLHRNNDRHVQWEIPGGKIDAGEEAQDTAIREVKEELGVEVKIHKKLGQKKFVQGDATMHYTWYSASILKSTPKVMEPETFDDLRYFSKQEMRQNYESLSPNAQNYFNLMMET